MDGKGFNLVNQGRGYKKKEHIGLGIFSHKDMNRALLCKCGGDSSLEGFLLGSLSSYDTGGRRSSDLGVLLEEEPLLPSGTVSLKSATSSSSRNCVVKF